MNLLRELDAIAFDFDGTLADTKEGIVNCMNHAFIKFGLPELPAETIEAAIGPPLFQMFENILQTRDEALLAGLVAVFRERYGSVGYKECRLYDGIDAFIKELHARGKKLFVVTMKPEKYAVDILDSFGLLGCFRLVKGTSLAKKTNENKTLFIKEMQGNGTLSPRSCLIGDRAEDIKAAKSNNITAIGVGYGYGEIDDLKNAGADFVFETQSSLIEAFLEERKAR